MVWWANIHSTTHLFAGNHKYTWMSGHIKGCRNFMSIISCVMISEIHHCRDWQFKNVLSGFIVKLWESFSPSLSQDYQMFNVISTWFMQMDVGKSLWFNTKIYVFHYSFVVLWEQQEISLTSTLPVEPVKCC